MKRPRIRCYTPSMRTNALVVTGLALAGLALFAGCRNVVPSDEGLAVTYNANGATEGSVPVDENRYQPGETATVLGNTGGLIAAGDAFSGWNTAADGSGSDYGPGSELTIGDTDVTLFAQFERQESTSWVSTTAEAFDGTEFTAVAAGPGGDVWVVGRTVNGGQVNFGSGAVFDGGSGGGAFIIRFDDAGTAVWGVSVQGSDGSRFTDVVVDSNGNAYAVGYISGTGSHTINSADDSDIAFTSVLANNDPVLIRYSPDGSIDWVRGAVSVTGSGASAAGATFDALALDPDGSLVVIGSQSASISITYQADPSVTIGGPSTQRTLLRFNLDGTATDATGDNGTGDPMVAQATSSVILTAAGEAWAVGTVSGTIVEPPTTSFSQGYIQQVGSGFSTDDGTGADVAFGGSAPGTGDTVYVAGEFTGGGSVEIDSDTAVSVNGAEADTQYPLLVAYAVSGNPDAVWAYTASSVRAGSDTAFADVTVDQFGNIFAVGYQSGTGAVDWGSGVTSTGAFAGRNAVVLRLSPSGDAVSVWTPTAASDETVFTAAADSAAGLPVVAGFQVGTAAVTWPGNRTSTGNFNGPDGVLVRLLP